MKLEGTGSLPDRAQAWALLQEFNKEDFHLRHARAVEAVMRHYAEGRGCDSEEVAFWGAVGILHDLDYEQWPDQHCVKARELLEERGIHPAFVHAVVSHGYGIVSDVEPVHPMENVLFATDELTGLISAVAIMRPSHSLHDLPVKSVMKKFKTANFAAGCSRDVIRQGAERMGVSVEELVEGTIAGMRKAAGELGLDGSA